MGVCLCKDKVEDAALPDNISIPNGSGSGGVVGDIGSLDNIWPCSRNDRIVSLSETVDRLVKETLEVIGTIVDK